MTKAIQDDWAELDIPDAPITPESKDENKYTHSGWKFYAHIRTYLNTYWNEFNSTLDSKGRVKYKTVRAFIKDKFKKSADRDMFYIMVCPYEEYEILSAVDYGKSNKKVLPWLGDWYSRRRNGYWQEPNSVYIDRKSTRLNSSHLVISYAVFCLKKKNNTK